MPTPRTCVYITALRLRRHDQMPVHLPRTAPPEPRPQLPAPPMMAPPAPSPAR